jgi:hypothetical protein
MSLGDFVTIAGLVLGAISAGLLGFDALNRIYVKPETQKRYGWLGTSKAMYESIENDWIESYKHGRISEARFQEEMAAVMSDAVRQQARLEKDAKEYPEKYEKKVYVLAVVGTWLLVLAFAVQVIGVYLQARERKEAVRVQPQIESQQYEPPPGDIPMCVGPFKQGEVLGSVDKTPLRASLIKKYGSNRGLAEARAIWVETRMEGLLRVHPPSTVIFSSGPTIEAKNGKDRERDRFVEVHEVWGSVAQRESATALLETSLPVRLITGHVCPPRN